MRVVVVNDANGKQRKTIYPLQIGSKRYGQCGVEISDWFPQHRLPRGRHRVHPQHVDDG